METGTNKPKVRLFNGAIGNAYHWLYEPLMPYKNELSLILNLEIKGLTAQQKEEIIALKLRNEELTKENIALKRELK